jgi:hypothetical protein
MEVIPVVTDASALAYIGSVRWQFAKAMPDWPHEYTVKAWRPDLTDDFERFCLLLENVGVVEPWPPPPAQPIYNNRYLVIGRHKYWALGPRGDQDLPEDRTVINRVVVEAESCPPPGSSASMGTHDER